MHKTQAILLEEFVHFFGWKRYWWKLFIISRLCKVYMEMKKKNDWIEVSEFYSFTSKLSGWRCVLTIWPLFLLLYCNNNNCCIYFPCRCQHLSSVDLSSCDQLMQTAFFDMVIHRLMGKRLTSLTLENNPNLSNESLRVSINCVKQ